MAQRRKDRIFQLTSHRHPYMFIKNKMKPSAVLSLALLLSSGASLRAINTDLKTINLVISDGQFGGAVSEDDEETIGAFTVANKNDTDGDSAIDAGDSDGDVSGEKDLMKLVVNPPAPNDNPEAGVALSIPKNAKLYKSSDKKDGEQTPPTWKAKDLPQTYWVELQDASSAVRSEVFTLTGGGATDTVKATGVWVEKTENSFKHLSTESCWAQGECDDFGIRQLFSHLSPTLVFGKVFTKPPAGEVHYMCGFEFVCKPSGLSEIGKVKFDCTRQKDARAWKLEFGEWEKILSDPWPLIDIANDDRGINNDNDNNPNRNNHIYSIDGPGTPNNGAFDEFVLRGNFLEFVRVRFDGAVPDALESGSRTSDKVKWHCLIWLHKDGVGYAETSDKPNEVELEHVNINTANTNEDIP